MQVVLGLGTNLGDREANLARALDALERLEGTQIVKLSNLYGQSPLTSSASRRTTSTAACCWRPA